MNNDKLKNLEIKNKKMLLKIYKKHIRELKIYIYEATEKGNDTTYLQSLHDSVEKEIILFEKDLKQYTKQSTTTAYKMGAEMAVVGKVAEEVAGAYTFGTVNREAMKVLAKSTYQPLSKMAQQIGRATLEYMKRENFESTQTVLKALNKFVDSEFLRKTGIEGIADVVVGSSSWQKVAREIREKIIKDGGIKVPYYKKDGSLCRMVDAQEYSKMVARTTTANVLREGTKDRILKDFEDDGDLVEIIGHSIFPNSPCIPYEGKILSLEGRTKGYTTIAEAKANGLFHPNCIHSFAVTNKVMRIYGYSVSTENSKTENGGTLVEPKTGEETAKTSGEEKKQAEYKTFNSGDEANKFFYENKEYQKWAKNLIQDEKDVITQYTDFSDDINQYLRKLNDWQYIDREMVTGQIQEIDNAIKGFELQKSIQVIRGVSVAPFGDNLNDLAKIIGKEFTDKAYISTSLIENGIKQERPVQLFLNIPKGKGRGAYINEFSSYNNEEYEFLLKRNTTYKIISAKFENGIYFLEADVLP